MTTTPNTDDWRHLTAYGYAPGNYLSRCHKCGDTPVMDKRATTCRPCAEKMYDAALTSARNRLVMETLDDEPAVIGAGCWPTFKPGSWTDIPTVDDLERFYLSRLPAIREAAQALGYAIGLHGSCRRDLDLIAAPWRDGAADADTLAHAVAQAACGIDRAGAYDWEQKPAGRVATSIPICWPAWHGQAGAGHIDLSVMPAA